MSYGLNHKNLKLGASPNQKLSSEYFRKIICLFMHKDDPLVLKSSCQVLQFVRPLQVYELFKFRYLTQVFASNFFYMRKQMSHYLKKKK